ncbi:MAG: hypothetical protein AVDCRST_MAG74-3354 [uncultured Pyrinomonadaceae bacterium]|uniref:Uncharacterized protein n=1 Tax=uncultured Pyrinomonadaceae bacterium TaxID=2283094 RepID=A0A6J4PZN7_9BACT|nr:MAG: hypothetical protein AVDCRST_MAG74-3354 [uncultured Pyrinomonadaceae bacterium]
MSEDFLTGIQMTKFPLWTNWKVYFDWVIYFTNFRQAIVIIRFRFFDTTLSIVC